MRSLQAILVIVGAFVIVMLAASTVVWAGTLTCSTADFDVEVTVTHASGRSTYEYNLTRADANSNKFFIYLKRGLDDPATGDFKFKCNGGAFSPPGDPFCSGNYIRNGDNLSGAVLNDTWDDNKHNDGLQVTSVATGTFPITIDVTEREPGLEQEDETSIIFPVGNKEQVCGPIEGPMQAQKRAFEGNPIVSTVVEQTFANGCIYSVTFNPVTNVVTSMEALISVGTIEPDDCTDIDLNADCAADTNTVFCPPGRIGQPPIQHLAGGTCYYGDIKFPC